MSSADPVCPSCSEAIRFRHSATFWNPWDYPCPHCKARLEASIVQKAFAIAAIPLGLLLAGIAIHFERTGEWGKQETMIFFGAVVVGLLVGVITTWKHTRFTVKEEK